MREFYVFLKDGTGMIVDAYSESDVYSMYGSRIVSIEETPESIERNKNKNDKKIDIEYEMYLERLYNECLSLNEIEERIKKSIKIVEMNNRIPVWEKNFIYGLRRSVKLGKTLSQAQKEKFNKIYSKISV